MTLEISRSVIDAIVTAADGSPDREICGLLFGLPGRIDGYRLCDNVAADPRSTFEIDPRALIAAHRAARAGGPAIAGCFHSHPSGAPEPSATDAAQAAPDGSVWLIAAGLRVGVWRAVADGGRHGRFDAVAWQSST